MVVFSCINDLYALDNDINITDMDVTNRFSSMSRVNNQLAFLARISSFLSDREVSKLNRFFFFEK